MLCVYIPQHTHKSHQIDPPINWSHTCARLEARKLHRRSVTSTQMLAETPAPTHLRRITSNASSPFSHTPSGLTTFICIYSAYTRARTTRGPNPFQYPMHVVGGIVIARRAPDKWPTLNQPNRCKCVPIRRGRTMPATRRDGRTDDAGDAVRVRANPTPTVARPPGRLPAIRTRPSHPQPLYALELDRTHGKHGCVPACRVRVAACRRAWAGNRLCIVMCGFGSVGTHTHTYRQRKHIASFWGSGPGMLADRVQRTGHFASLTTH